MKKLIVSSLSIAAIINVTFAFADTWYVTAPGATAKWVRTTSLSDNPGTYDGNWTNSSGQHGTVAIISIVGNSVSVVETWNGGAGQCNYNGTITDAKNGNVSGTYICGGQPPYIWTALVYAPYPDAWPKQK